MRTLCTAVGCSLSAVRVYIVATLFRHVLVGNSVVESHRLVEHLVEAELKWLSAKATFLLAII